MLRIVPMEAWHLRYIMTRDPKSEYLASIVTDEQIKAIVASPWSRSALAGDLPIAVAGMMNYWENRAEVWSFIDPHCREHFLALHRVAQRYLAECTIRRIEAAVDVDFPQGHRWCELLGFKKEADRLEAYSPDGKDHALYALIRR